MSTETDPEAPPRRAPLWRRLLLTTLGFLAAVLLLTGVLYYVNRGQMVGRLDRVTKELNETDPNWKMDDLLRSRPEVLPDEDSVPRILAIARGLPRGWPDHKKYEKVVNLSPNAVLDPERRKVLDEFLAAVPAQRLAARELIRYPRGRLDVVVAENPIETLMPDHQKLRDAANLLSLDSWQLALDGKADEAFGAHRATLNVSRALEDDPFLIGQLIRIAVASIAMGNMERTLAVGEASDAALAAAQKDLQREMASTGLQIAMKGERASTHKIMQLIATGKMNAAELEGMMSGKKELSLFQWFTGLMYAEAARREHPDMLLLMTKIVKASGLPAHEQIDAEDEIEREIKTKAGHMTKLLVPAVNKVSQAGRRMQCAAVAMHTLLAVERYRLKHGDFPADLNKLVPAYLPKVPLDPIDAKPIRYKRTADGVVVYSIGNNRTDDGGNVERLQADFGYRLWDVKKRRQPAPPLPPPEPEGGMGPMGPGAPPPP